MSKRQIMKMVRSRWGITPTPGIYSTSNRKPCLWQGKWGRPQVWAYSTFTRAPIAPKHVVVALVPVHFWMRAVVVGEGPRWSKGFHQVSSYCRRPH